MSGHHSPLGMPHRHSAHPAFWAAAAVLIILAAGACTSTTSTNTPASVVAAASTGPGGHKPTLSGAGSTFDAPFFSVAFARYQQQHPGVSIGYSAVGSSAGIAAFSAGQVDFGASDVPMTAREQAAAKGGPITQVPVALGGEGVVYNLSLPAGARLHLTGPVLAAIFLGQITRWNDPAITALNPGLSLPPARINVVHRSDGSGGVAAAVNRTSFSIGYVEQRRVIPDLPMVGLLFRGVQEIAAGLLAAPAGLGADPAVRHVGVAHALIAAAPADGHAGLQQRPGDSGVVVRQAADDPRGGGADIGAVQAQPDARDHLGHVRLAQVSGVVGVAGLDAVAERVDGSG
jgi:hypothetical protein